MLAVAILKTATEGEILINPSLIVKGSNWCSGGNKINITMIVGSNLGIIRVLGAIGGSSLHDNNGGNELNSSFLTPDNIAGAGNLAPNGGNGATCKREHLLFIMDLLP